MKKKIIGGVIIGIVLVIGIIIWWQGRDVSTTTGTIVDISENSLLLLTEEWIELGGETATGDLSFSWEDAEDFQAGDQVKIWIKGPIATSFPAQATVIKVEKIT